MFGKKMKLFKLLGFEVSVDVSWIIIALLIAWSLSTGLFPFHYKDLSTRTYWMMGILGALGLFVSIILHEFAHSLVARKHGMPMKGITLFIFGGVAEMGEEPPNPKAEFFMAIVGPLASLAIAAVFYAIHVVWGPAMPLPADGVVGYLALINAILAFFNMVPAFPLDGGRVLRSILWGVQKNLDWATKISSMIGSGFGIFLIVMGVLNVFTGNFVGGMWWFLIGMFLQSAARMSYQKLVTRRALEGEPISRFMKSDPVVVPPDTSVESFVNDYVYTYHYKMYPVVDQNQKLSGYVTSKQMKDIPKEEWGRTRVFDIVQEVTDENSVGPQKDATEALGLMNRHHLSRLLVVDKERLVGIISLKDLLRFLSLKVELEG